MESTKFMHHLLLSGFLALNSAAVFADMQNLELEPAVSGGVSASGLYESQAREDLQLEPAVSGGVSASGLYPSQALENAAVDRKKAAAATANEDRLGSGEDDVISAFGGHRDDFSR